MKYADAVAGWLVELGYTHCFFLAGGNIMHLLDAVSRTMTCVPVVHEVAAGVAAEYFNESGGDGRAFALVTAGPGLTNIVSALAGAYLESRELLVIGGQVKSTDLASGGIRQRGIQEVDGVRIAEPLCVASARIERPVSRSCFVALAEAGSSGRKGPVFVEMCLDAQGAPFDPAATGDPASPAWSYVPKAEPDLVDPGAAAEQIASITRVAERPVWLLGGGVSRQAAAAALPALRTAGVPVMTTWNGADRVGAEEPFYFGRPNTWGQRYANVLVQQADLLVVFGSRLGLQQTGFNHQQFVPAGQVVQVEVDPAELAKGHPRVDGPLLADAGAVLERSLRHELGNHEKWLDFCRSTKDLLPLNEAVNQTADGYISPYELVAHLSRLCTAEDVIIPCSSGGAFTGTYQALLQKQGQVVVTDKGLASMGYGLAGAIGAALARPGRRTVLIEGDGGFAQNIQELGTVAMNHLNLKMFVLDNDGYASIRTTQRSYFGGRHVGCDERTGVGLPDWPKLFDAYGIACCELGPDFAKDDGFLDRFEASGPAAFVVPVDPEQTYFPKITSRITANGSMESNPLHLMTPNLPTDVAAKVFRWLE